MGLPDEHKTHLISFVKDLHLSPSKRNAFLSRNAFT